MGLVLIFVLFSLCAGINCTFTSGIMYDYDSVVSCFALFPFNQTVVQHTVTNLKKALQLYVFRDIAKAPPQSFETVDLDKELSALETATFPSDFAFHEALRSVFVRLRDAHTMVYSPIPYQIEISDISNVAYPSAWPLLNVSDFFGAKVVTIDGVPALQALKDFAINDVGLAKDAQVRYNIAVLERPPFSGFNSGLSVPWRGLFSFRPHHFMLTPKNSSVSFGLVFANGTASQVSIPWKASPMQSFPDTATYEKSYWSTNKIFAEEKIHRKSERTVQVLFNDTADGLGFYLLSDGTLVWYQNNFAPSNTALYLQTVVESLLVAQQKGARRLILDFSLNGGGSLCLGRAMLSILFPKTSNFPPTDMCSTPLAQLLALQATKLGTSLWKPQIWMNVQTGADYTDVSYMIPGIVRTRGGIANNYTQLIALDSATNGNCGVPPVIFTTPLFDATNIVFLSKGFCGSTCALFISHLREVAPGVRTVSVGGFDASQAMTFRSFPGGQVLDSFSFYFYLNQLQLNPTNQSDTSSLVPRFLITSASYRFCAREMYLNLNSTDTPLEYVVQNADFHWSFSRAEAIDPSQLWNRVSATMWGKK